MREKGASLYWQSRDPARAFPAIAFRASSAISAARAASGASSRSTCPRGGVGWYVGNLHKWAFAARGAAIIWCTPERQAALHPVSISHHLGPGFAAMAAIRLPGVEAADRTAARRIARHLPEAHHISPAS
ncbi:MAG TPA: hypothetical protein VME45_20405 [Stellaceae bacterium]|nr:hypothetical protein [Stellaceae bacterium]